MTKSESPMTFDARETILVIGLGKSGQSSVEVLRSRGAAVYAVDEKPLSEIGDVVARIEAQGASFTAPSQLDDVLPNVTSAVLSPGVPLNGALVRRVQNANVPVFSEIEVAARLCKAPIIAVSGTKGKSTTTSLIGHLLRSCGKSVRVGGNIGNPLISEVLGASADDWVVAEVSSFQLESIRSFKPRVAVLINISADHLDRYHSMDEYAEAKYRIVANQDRNDTFVGNLDDVRVAALRYWEGPSRLHARALWFSAKEKNQHAAMYLRERSIAYAPVTGDPRPLSIMLCDEIPLAGEHNVQNVMAGLLAALAIGLEPAALREAVMSFTPMSHRLETVADIGGVLYVDDSKATNPGAAIAALQAYDRPIVLIAGGISKNTDFAELGAVADRRAKAVVLIGQAADALGAATRRSKTVRAESMGEAVELARSLAEEGDVVLLSPACASFDMFRSAEHRGEQFAAAVRELA